MREKKNKHWFWLNMKTIMVILQITLFMQILRVFTSKDYDAKQEYQLLYKFPVC